VGKFEHVFAVLDILKKTLALTWPQLSSEHVEPFSPRAGLRLGARYTAVLPSPSLAQSELSEPPGTENGGRSSGCPLAPFASVPNHTTNETAWLRTSKGSATPTSGPHQSITSGLVSSEMTLLCGNRKGRNSLSSNVPPHASSTRCGPLLLG
jgi:hypothetical protein